MQLVTPKLCRDTVPLQLVSQANLAFWAGPIAAEMGLLDYATSDPFYFRLDMFPRTNLLIPKLKRKTVMLHLMNK